MLSSRLLRFAAVGSVGFIVDASILLLAVSILGVSPLPARVVSFLIAASVTFALNQRFTFQLSGALVLSRWLSYLATTALGAGINVGVFRLWVIFAGASPVHLVLGTALGSIAAMFINYAVSRAWIFRSTK